MSTKANLAAVKIAPVYYTYVIPTIILFIVLYFVLKRTGLIKGPPSPEEKAAEQIKEEERLQIRTASNQATKDDGLNPRFWQQTNLQSILSVPLARQKARRIEQALGTFLTPTDEEEIYQVYNELTTQAQASQIAWEFGNMFGKPLLEEFLRDLSNPELAKVRRIINALPKEL